VLPADHLSNALAYQEGGGSGECGSTRAFNAPVRKLALYSIKTRTNF